MNKKYLYYGEQNKCMEVCPEYKVAPMGPEFKLARAYVPYQRMCDIFDPMKALAKGTIFPELYDPYPKC